MKYDLHIHSEYSKDSLLSPKRIIKVAKKFGLDGIAITDHNTLKGGLEALKINDDKNFKVVIGSEIKTEYDDVIGLFLSEEIKSRKLDEVIEEIHAQGGLAGLAHPYRKYLFPKRIVKKFDFVEGFNARSRKADNAQAYSLALEHNKPLTAGSDAHLGYEIGRGRAIADDDLREDLARGKVIIEGNESAYYLVHGTSVTIDMVKRIGGII